MSWTNAKVEGVGVSQAFYQSFGQDGKKGEREYVMSRSQLTRFLACPSKWRRMDEKDEPTAAMIFGDMVDCLLTTPDHFGERFHVRPETYPDSKTGEQKPWNGNSNHCKQWLADHADRPVIRTSGEMGYVEAGHAMQRLRGDPQVQDLIAGAHFQVMVTASWVDKETDIVVPVKTLVDIVPHKERPNRQALADLKTDRSAAQRAFKRTVFDRGYHVQAALYLDVYNAATHDGRTDWLIPVVENTPPFEVGRRMLPVEFITLGRDTYQRALRWYCKCLKEDFWPSYDDGNDTINGWTVVQPEAWMVTSDFANQTFEDPAWMKDEKEDKA